jgi:hypothetical protein
MVIGYGYGSYSKSQSDVFGLRDIRIYDTREVHVIG